MLCRPVCLPALSIRFRFLLLLSLSQSAPNVAVRKSAGSSEDGETAIFPSVRGFVSKYSAQISGGDGGAIYRGEEERTRPLGGRAASPASRCCVVVSFGRGVADGGVVRCRAGLDTDWVVQGSGSRPREGKRLSALVEVENGR